eukprot:9467298-Pyramimonas_sp.AAC.3
MEGEMRPMGYDTTAQREPEADERDLNDDVGPEVDGEAPLSGKFAKKVVNELYERYNTLVRPRFWHGCYKNPYPPLWADGIRALLHQTPVHRDASAAYSVVSTIQGSGLTPEVRKDMLEITRDTETSSVDTIYDHIEGIIDTFWVVSAPVSRPASGWFLDPVCGDDKCEDPFEFAFYGRFGCKADCGTLGDYDQVTPIQVDLYYDFHHAAGPFVRATCKHTASCMLYTLYRPVADAVGAWQLVGKLRFQAESGTTTYLPCSTCVHLQAPLRPLR